MSVRNGIFAATRLPVTKPALNWKLGLPEALGLSLSSVGASKAMAFNVSLAVRAAGRAAPMAFVIGTLSLLMDALAFISFAHLPPGERRSTSSKCLRRPGAGSARTFLPFICSSKDQRSKLCKVWITRRHVSATRRCMDGTKSALQDGTCASLPDSCPAFEQGGGCGRRLSDVCS